VKGEKNKILSKDKNEIADTGPGNEKNQLFLTVLTFVLLFGCSHLDNEIVKQPNRSQPLNGEAKILESWQGDYPVDQLQLLPEKQRQQIVGFIENAETFAGVWKAFKPGEAIPEIDFKGNLILFARNTHFFNRISIGKVNVTNGVAQVLTMETMSAMPIEDKVAMFLVVVPRSGITAIQTGDEIFPVNKKF
jgi:hypothetical protein